MVAGATTADLTLLVNRLQQAGPGVRVDSQKILERTGNEIMAQMLMLVPVKTGRLRNSIRLITEPGRVIVGPVDVDYAPYVEYGTGIHSEFGGSYYEIKPKTATNLAFRVNGHWVHTKVVKHPGIKPEPYVRPAAAAVLTNIGVAFAEAGQRRIVTGAAA